MLQSRFIITGVVKQILLSIFLFQSYYIDQFLHKVENIDAAIILLNLLE